MMSPWGFGRGRGFGPNPFWSCRWFPWLPRWWWAYPPEVLAQLIGPPIPQHPPTDQPVGFETIPGPAPTQFGPFDPTMFTLTKEQEIQMLEQQMDFFRQQLERIQKRLNELTRDE